MDHRKSRNISLELERSALSASFGDSTEFFPVLWQSWLFYLTRGEHETALELGEQMLEIGEELEDEVFLLEAHLAAGGSYFYIGELERAHRHFAQTVALYDREKHRSLAFRFGGIDPVAPALGYDAWTLWLLGYPEQARTRGEELSELRGALPFFSQARALYYETVVHHLRRDTELARTLAEQAIELATERGFAILLALGPLMRAWAMDEPGDGFENLRMLRTGVEAYRSTGAQMQAPHFLGLLARSLARSGRPDEGRETLRDAIELASQNGEHYYTAELQRLEGELRESFSPVDRREAAACYLRALSVAKRQGAKSFELRAATSLARLWQSQGKRDDARAVLAPVYHWFTEGFDTADLREANALLEELA